MTTVWFATMIGFIFSFFILRKISKQIEITKLLDSPTTWELGRILLDLIFGLYRKRFKKIRNWKIQDDVTVMDVGCGTGQYSKITSGKYLGIDLNSNYINYCVNKYANNHNKSFRCADVITLLNEKARFDVVLMVDFLHHIPDDIAKKILRTSSELATKYIICFEPILEQSNVIGRLIINNDRGDHIRSLDELHELFHDTGCKIIESSEIWLGPIRSRAILAIPSVSI